MTGSQLRHLITLVVFGHLEGCFLACFEQLEGVEDFRDLYSMVAHPEGLGVVFGPWARHLSSFKRFESFLTEL